MAYENLQLVVSAMLGDIYLARVNKGNVMSDNRRVITEDVLRATTEWFISNKHNMIQYPDGKDNTHAVFYTNDPIKRDKIKAILLNLDEETEENCLYSVVDWDEGITTVTDDLSDAEKEYKRLILANNEYFYSEGELGDDDMGHKTILSKILKSQYLEMRDTTDEEKETGYGDKIWEELEYDSKKGDNE